MFTSTVSEHQFSLSRSAQHTLPVLFNCHSTSSTSLFEVFIYGFALRKGTEMNCNLHEKHYGLLSRILFFITTFLRHRAHGKPTRHLKRPKTGRKRSVNARQSVGIVETFCKAPAKKKRSDYSANIVFFRVRKIFRFVFCVTQHSDKLRRVLKVNLVKHFWARAGFIFEWKFGTFLLEYLRRSVDD